MSPIDIATVCIIAAVPVVWIAWDVYVGLVRSKGGATAPRTESMFLAEWARSFNVLPFLCGALVGHWWVQTPYPGPDYALWPVALAAAVCVFVWDLLCYPWGVKGATVRLLQPAKWLRYPGLWLAFGVLVGWLFWGQRLP